MREAPQPTYNYEVNDVVKKYQKALKDVQNELNSMFLTNFERDRLKEIEKNIKDILTDLKDYTDEWATAAINKAVIEGVAATVYVLNLADTFNDALQTVGFNKINKQLVAAAVADTQSDLLAITQNIDRQAKNAIRRATAEAMRHTLLSGNNATTDISKEIKKRIVQATDVAIIDSRGRRWSVKNYSNVIARTNMMNAHREATINQALSEGSFYGRISRHGATDACSKYEGMIVKLIPDAPGDYPYIGDLPRNEIFHPCCKHIVTPVRVPEKV